MENFPLKAETYKIIGLCMEVQKNLGYGFSEAVYKDAMAFEFIVSGLTHCREKEMDVFYKGRKLKHKFFADFICFEDIIVEAQSSDKGICDDHIAQASNYLRVADKKVALIINFGKPRLEYKRLIYG